METETREDILMSKIIKFYSDSKNMNAFKLMHDNTKSPISLRILDWFSTNYSKKYGISYMVKKGIEYKHFNVYVEYKSQLDAYSKKYFDPFCRRNRIKFNISKNDYIITTVGQLNFFRWVIENDIIKYILANYEDIENDMNKIHKEQYGNKKDTKTRKKREKLVSKNNINISTINQL